MGHCHPTKQKVRRTSPYVQNDKSRFKAGNNAYCHPITFNDQSAYPKRGRFYWNVSFFFFGGGGLAEDFPGSIIWWNPPCQIHKSPEEDNVLLSIE